MKKLEILFKNLLHKIITTRYCLTKLIRMQDQLEILKIMLVKVKDVYLDLCKVDCSVVME